MDTGFEDKVKLTSKKTKKSPWDFTQPAYDQRSSGFINAGTIYGVGKKQPVGTLTQSKNGYAVPLDKVKTLQVMDLPTKSFDEM